MMKKVSNKDIQISGKLSCHNAHSLNFRIWYGNELVIRLLNLITGGVHDAELRANYRSY